MKNASIETDEIFASYKVEIGEIVEAMRKDIVTFLQNLIQIKSENPPGDYETLCRFLDGKLSEFGFTVEVLDVPHAVVAQHGLSTSRKNILASLRAVHLPDRAKRIILNSHLDTVPAGDPARWTFAPFSGQVDDGKIFGRGATDSKGRLTAYIMACVALKRCRIPINGEIIIAATCDEETGGTLGAGYLLENGLLKGDAVIVEGYSNQIINASAGVLQVRFVTLGRSAHAGVKWKGISAIEKMTKVVQALMGFQEDLSRQISSTAGMKFTTVNIGTIRGGDKLNVVPDRCEIEVDFRVIPEQSKDDIFKSAVALADRVKKDDAEIEIIVEKIPGFETEPTLVPVNHPLIEKLQHAIESVTGERLAVNGTMVQTDLRWFIKQGIPGINFGPGTIENHIHGYDEFLEVEDLIQSTKVIALYLSSLLCDLNEKKPL